MLGLCGTINSDFADIPILSSGQNLAFPACYNDALSYTCHVEDRAKCHAGAGNVNGICLYPSHDIKFKFLSGGEHLLLALRGEDSSALTATSNCSATGLSVTRQTSRNLSDSSTTYMGNSNSTSTTTAGEMMPKWQYEKARLQ